MNRLQNATEEALGNNDPSGASLFSGRAALMAGQLASRAGDERDRAWLRAKESLFRAQERLYKGLAMYKLAGNAPPASAGVCGMIEQGSGMAGTAISSARKELGDKEQSRLRELEEWGADLDNRAKAIRQDLQCP